MHTRGEGDDWPSVDGLGGRGVVSHPQHLTLVARDGQREPLPPHMSGAQRVGLYPREVSAQVGVGVRVAHGEVEGVGGVLGGPREGERRVRQVALVRLSSQ